MCVRESIVSLATEISECEKRMKDLENEISSNQEKIMKNGMKIKKIFEEELNFDGDITYCGDNNQLIFDNTEEFDKEFFNKLNHLGLEYDVRNTSCRYHKDRLTLCIRLDEVGE